MEGSESAGLPETLLKALDEAQRYPKGTGLRFVVKTERGLASLKKLAPIKLAY